VNCRRNFIDILTTTALRTNGGKLNFIIRNKNVLTNLKHKYLPYQTRSRYKLIDSPPIYQLSLLGLNTAFKTKIQMRHPRRPCSTHHHDDPSVVAAIKYSYLSHARITHRLDQQINHDHPHVQSQDLSA